MKKIYIIGAGGHSRSIINLLELSSYTIKGIYDENFKKGEKICGYKLLETISDIKNDGKVVLAMGDNKKREYFYNALHHNLLKDNLIHPAAIIEKRVKIKGSNQVFSGVYINTGANIGEDNILNTGCIIEHEVKIGNHNHIAVGCLICGRAKVGDRCFIGAGAIIIDKLRIGNDIIIGAGSVVVRNIDRPGTYTGIPAKRIR